MYLDLHLGVTREDIPPEVKEIGISFIASSAFGTRLCKSSMTTICWCQLRQFLKDWIDKRVQDIINDRLPNPEKTMVYYWIKNPELGENFRSYFLNVT
jgi:hypothetical protein